MPRLSMWRPNKTNDYRFFDRTISEMYTVGGLDIYVHKYMGPKVQPDDGANGDATQPVYPNVDVLFIEDLLLLENRDRVYDPDVYTMRGVYNVQDIDFDLTQFGLFLNGDTLFITFHYNDMINTIGRKLMSGDVIEVPNLKDPNPLNAAITRALPKFYVIQDASYPAEGFSRTWLPHLWRVKCTPLVNSQEYKDILDKPLITENIWDPGNFWPVNWIVNNGGTYYRSVQNVPAGTPITDTAYWQQLTAVPWQENVEYPAETIVVGPNGEHWMAIQDVPPGVELGDPAYWEPAAEPDGVPTIDDVASTRPKDLEINDALLAQAQVEVPLSGYDTVRFYIFPTNPDGTPADPNGPTIDQTTGFDVGNYDINPYDNISYGPEGLPTYDPAISDAAQTPRSNGYTMGYLTGDGIAPNGLPVTPGVSFPTNPQEGDYALRLDYFPNRLFRFNGRTWVKIEDSVRTDLTNGPQNDTLRSSFVNNTYTTPTNDQGNIPSRQSLSDILKPRADNGNQGGNKPANPYPGTQPGQPSS